MYSDGHVVVSFSRILKDIDQIFLYSKHAEALIEYRSEGRIAFSEPETFIAAYLAGAKGVRVIKEDTSHGSQNTKKRGIAVGYLQFYGGDWGLNPLCFYSIEGLNSGWTKQDSAEYHEDFDPEIKSWGTTSVVKVYRKDSK